MEKIPFSKLLAKTRAVLHDDNGWEDPDLDRRSRTYWVIGAQYLLAAQVQLWEEGEAPTELLAMLSGKVLSHDMVVSFNGVECYVCGVLVDEIVVIGKERADVGDVIALVRTTDLALVPVSCVDMNA